MTDRLAMRERARGMRCEPTPAEQCLWGLLRYWNAEVVDHPHEVAEAILRAVGRGP